MTFVIGKLNDLRLTHHCSRVLSLQQRVPTEIPFTVQSNNPHIENALNQVQKVMEEQRLKLS